MAGTPTLPTMLQSLELPAWIHTIAIDPMWSGHISAEMNPVDTIETTRVLERSGKTLAN